jgi:hypothetical protein
MALVAQRAFWRSLLRDSLRLTDILASFKSMEAAEVTAKYVYKRVLERYPQVSRHCRGAAGACVPFYSPSAQHEAARARLMTVTAASRCWLHLRLTNCMFHHIAGDVKNSSMEASFSGGVICVCAAEWQAPEGVWQVSGVGPA